MAKLREEETSYPIWIDHTGKIVSFKDAEGFEIMYFLPMKKSLLLQSTSAPLATVFNNKEGSN